MVVASLPLTPTSEILFPPNADSGVLIAVWLQCFKVFGTFEGKRRRLLRDLRLLFLLLFKLSPAEACV